MLVFAGNWYVGKQGFIAPGMAFALWSISLEEQFYLVWPTLCRSLGKIALIAVCVLLVPLSAFTIAFLLHHGAKPNPELWTNSFVQFQMFGMGALLAIFLNGRIPKLAAPARML